MSDWFRRKLNQPPAPARPVPSYAEWQHQQAAQPQPNLPAAVPPGLQQHQQVLPENMRVTPENFMQLSQYWKGGQGNREETDMCPRCGSRNYFSRKYTENGGKYKTPPAPQCAECNFTDGHINLTSEDVKFSPH